MCAQEHIVKIENLETSVKSDIGDVPLVRGINLSLQRGKTLGIVGETGSGKSMTIKSMLGLIDAEDIYVSFNKLSFNFEDSPYVFENSKARMLDMLSAQKIGVVFQHPGGALNPTRRCGNGLLYLLNRAGSKSTKVSKREVLEVFGKVGLKEADRIYRSFPHELSGGELQRIMISLALLIEAELLILDEPTSSLDLVVQFEILDLIKQLKEENSLSVILISHDLNVLGYLADQIVMMDAGEIIESLPTNLFFKTCVHEKSRSFVEAFLLENSKPHKEVKQKSNCIVDINGLGKKYIKKTNARRFETWALKSVSCQIYEEEMLAIIGASGSGKSTLAKCIAGIIPYDEGMISYPCDHHKIAYVLQDAKSALDPDLTVKSILIEVLRNQNKSWTVEELEAQCINILQEVELGEQFLRRKSQQLSGGQLQRVNLARALAYNADLLICDEITSGLDLVVQYKIVALLEQISKSKTIVMISHDIGLIEKCTHRTIIMHEGAISEMGWTKEIVNNPQSQYGKMLINSRLKLNIS